MVTVLGGITIATSDLLITLADNAGFSVMIIFAAFAILSLLVSCGLDETLKKPAPDMILEISQKVISIGSQKKVSPSYEPGTEGKITSIAEILEGSIEQKS